MSETVDKMMEPFEHPNIYRAKQEFKHISKKVVTKINESRSGIKKIANTRLKPFPKINANKYLIGKRMVVRLGGERKVNE